MSVFRLISNFRVGVRALAPLLSVYPYTKKKEFTLLLSYTDKPIGSVSNKIVIQVENSINGDLERVSRATE